MVSPPPPRLPHDWAWRVIALAALGLGIATFSMALVCLIALHTLLSGGTV